MSKPRIGEIRLTYAHLDKPWSYSGDEATAKYQTGVLINKQDGTSLNTIKEDYDRAVKEGVERYGTGFKAKATPLVRQPGTNKGLLIDCDEDERYSNDSAYQGHYLLNLKASTAPVVMAVECGKRALTKEEIQDVVYSGCYGYVTFNFYPYSKGMTGIAAGLANVIKTRDGESFGGRNSAQSDFDDLFKSGDSDDLSEFF
jgi:hypothetical protein